MSGVRLRVCPLFQGRLDKSLGLAVGLWPVWSVSFMPDTELPACFTKCAGCVAGPIIRQTPLDFHAACRIPGNGNQRNSTADSAVSSGCVAVWATRGASSRLDGPTERFVFEGDLTKRIFEVHVENILAPSLRDGDIVIRDNLSSHKSQVAEELIRSRKEKAFFLFAHSPDLNSIEKMWSKVKLLLRGIKAKTAEEIYSGINQS